MEKQKFFEHIRNKIKRRSILGAVGWSALSIISFVSAFAIGISSEVGWRIAIGGRNSDLGIPVPNWLVSLVLIGLGIWMIRLVVVSVKAIRSDEVYNCFMSKIKEQFSDVDGIDDSLSNADRCPYTKAELRCNESYVFFMIDDVIKLIRTDSIREIRPVNVRNSKIFYVVIITDDREKDFKIETNQKNVVALVKYLSDVCFRKNYRV